MSQSVRLPFRSALFTGLMLAAVLSQAAPRYDLQDPALAATVNKTPFTRKMLDVMYQSSAQGKVKLSRADVMRAAIESHLLGQYAVKTYGRAPLVEDNRVGFKPEVVLANEFTNMIQVAYRPQLQAALQRLGGSLDRTVTLDDPVKPVEWAQYLPPPDRLQLEIRMSPKGEKLAAGRVLLKYRFDEQTQGVVTLKDVYDIQNVQGRNEMVNRNSGYVQQQARSVVVSRFVDWWAARESGLSAAEIQGLRDAIRNKAYLDGYVTWIGIAADIHDDNQNLKAKAKAVTQKEVLAYYAQHKDEFKRVEGVRARHIVVADEKTANQLYERIQKGEKFADLARQYSLAADGKKGGDLGWIEANKQNNGQWITTFAFLQTPGQVSRPIRAPAVNGKANWELVMIDEKKEGYHPANSSTVRYEASQIIGRQKVIAEYRAVRSRLLDKADIRLHPELKGDTEWDIHTGDLPVAKPHSHDHGPGDKH